MLSARIRNLLPVLLLLAPAAPGAVISNVLLNAGFESGSGTTNASWSAGGSVYRLPNHVRSGTYAVKLFGNWSSPGDWNYSYILQQFPAASGQSWEGAAWGMNPPDDLMKNENFAATRIEFIDEAGNVIGGANSTAQILAATPSNQWQECRVRVQAPLNTVGVRFSMVFGQGPSQAGGSAWFDDCEFGLSTVTDQVTFVGKPWMIINGNAYPGPNNFATNCIWVDTNGWLHLAIRPVDGKWSSAEMGGWESYGYGEYRWQLDTRVDLLDPVTVLGLFPYEPTKGDNWNEIDFEFTRAFEGMAQSNLQFAIQPWYDTGNLHQVVLALTNAESTYRMMWTPGDIHFLTWRGWGTAPTSAADVVGEWTYAGPDVHVHSNEVVYMNYYLWQTNAPTDTQHLEVVVRDFSFTPFSGEYLRDEFDDNAQSNIWDLTGLWGVWPVIQETNGGLRVSPGDDWQTAGYITTNAIHWNDRKESFVFDARLGTVSVESARSGEDVRTVLSLSSEEVNGWLATNSLVLYGEYDSGGDELTFSLLTKTNLPNADGGERFNGILTNVSSYLSATGGIDMNIILGQGRYHLCFADRDGRPLPVTTNSGATEGLHDLGGDPHAMYWLVGAMNVTNARGTVVWDRTQVGVDLPAGVPDVSPVAAGSQAMQLSWTSFFARTYAVERSTNLVAGFTPVVSNITATPPANFFTDHLDAAMGFYRLGAK